MLAPVLASGTRIEREVFDADSARRKKKGDLDLAHVGRGAKMPWQTDGRRWHTQERVSHSGRACRWEGAALEFVIDELEKVEGLQPPNWNDRSVVEITGGRKQDGWFLHALTGEEWLLGLKFRVRRNTFKQAELEAKLNLPPLDDLDDLPIYGRGERVRVKNAKGPWQDVSLTVHWKRELDTPEFRDFLRQACDSFLGHLQRAKLNPEDLMPWKVLGRKWHLSRKGFPSGKRVKWTPDVLETLAETLAAARPDCSVDWQGKETVSFQTGDSVWAAVHTKRRSGLDLSMIVPPGRVALGRIASFGVERKIAPQRDGREAVQIRFDQVHQVAAPEFREFLRELEQTADSAGPDPGAKSSSR